MNPYLRLFPMPVLLLPALAAAGETQSKLAGSWAIVEGVKELAGKQEPIQEVDHGRVYAVIKPDGTFYSVGEFNHSALDQLVTAGDRVETPHAALSVTRSSYSEEKTELALHHDGGYDLSFEARLLPDGDVSFRSVTPSYGGADLVTNAILRRVEGDKPWEANNLIAEWKVPVGAALSVAISADSSFLIASDQQSVVKWDVAGRRETRRFTGHLADVCRVALSPDGRLVASGSRQSGGANPDEHTVRVWNVETGEQLQRIDAFSEVTGLSFLPDGRSLLAAGYPLSVAGARGLRQPQLVAGIWDTQTGELRTSFPHGVASQRAAVSPDGRRVLCSVHVAGVGTRLALFEVETGRILADFGEGLTGCDSLSFSPDGQRAITSSQEPFLREWSIPDGKLLRRIKGTPSLTSCAAYLPDGKRILAAHEGDNRLRLWDLKSGAELGQFAGHRGHVQELTVSADGRTAVSCSNDGTVRVWRIPPV